MSMPEFPEINPELTQAKALNMILASIAAEELALSHIINAEGEKLQYVLSMPGICGGRKPDIGEILAVNESAACLLDSVAQNQMILKSKMEKAIGALPKPCPCPEPPAPPCPPVPPRPECRCSAVFKALEKSHLWRTDCALCWSATHISGKCACADSHVKSKINLLSKGRFQVSFAVNVKTKSNISSDAAICLNMVNCRHRAEVFTVHACASEDKITTISLGGIIVETNHTELSSLVLRLVSQDSLIVEDAMLSVIEI